MEYRNYWFIEAGQFENQGYLCVFASRIETSSHSDFDAMINIITIVTDCRMNIERLKEKVMNNILIA